MGLSEKEWGVIENDQILERHGDTVTTRREVCDRCGDASPSRSRGVTAWPAFPVQAARRSFPTIRAGPSPC
jgi:hypothetical protein